jgi:copper chaperone
MLDPCRVTRSGARLRVVTTAEESKGWPQRSSGQLRIGGSMSTVTYSVPNITCGHCVHTITTELQGMAGVQEVEASAEAKRVRVTYAAPATPAAIESLLAEINYPVAK